jgi:hypothetical protein
MAHGLVLDPCWYGLKFRFSFPWIHPTIGQNNCYRNHRSRLQVFEEIGMHVLLYFLSVKLVQSKKCGAMLLFI